MKRAPAPEHIDLPALTLRAEVRAASINVEARTAEVIFSTGAPVQRYDWMSDTRYIETLSLKKDHVRLERLNNSAPFLNAHSAWELSDVIGVVVPESARIADGKAIATVRMSKREDVEPIWRDMQDGIVRNVSVGYRVHKYEQTEGESKLPVRLAVDWEPYEISAVPMGADDGAKVRAKDKTPTNPCVIVTRAAQEERTMAEETRPAETRKPIATLEPDPPASPAEPGEAPNDLEVASTAERERIQGILRGCEAARLPMSFANKLIEEKTSLLAAQGLILDTLRSRGREEAGPKPGGVKIVGADPLENVWRGITGALLHRLNPVGFPLDDNSRQYRMLSILRAAEECLEQRGMKTRGMSKMDVAGIALGLRAGGYHSTSDFPNILADVANKSLRRAYEEVSPTWLPISRRIPMADFKPVKRNQLGESPELKKILEHGEFTRGTVAEGKEQFALSTYGRIFNITRQALVNDDLDAFGRMATGFGRAARGKESDLVWAEILRNAAMGDAVALFHATHGNLTASGTAISVDALGVGRTAMQVQKGLDGLTYLNLDARYLIVPPGKRTLADQFTTVITPAQGSNVNPFAGRLSVISEARLSGGLLLDGETIAGSATQWYLAASTDQIDIVEYGFLDGEEGPVVESRVGWEVDALEIKCRHDFAAKVIDWRGLYANAGA